MPSQQPELIYTPNGQLFVGRVTEQEDMRYALRDMLQPNRDDETLPAIFLLYGDGGIGKTSLSQRFEAIASEEEPFAGAFQILRVDWEEQRRRVPALQVAREQISPDTVLELFYKQAAKEWGDKAFTQYQQVKAQLHEVEQEAEKRFPARGMGMKWGVS
ncbi:MAG: ATP-binding protein [Chloroflexi bacterium]|nr:ATP-binding protein [Chloroflexota bacterium]